MVKKSFVNWIRARRSFHIYSTQGKEGTLVFYLWLFCNSQVSLEEIGSFSKKKILKKKIKDA
jgi:hypothetical protein